VTVAHEAGLVTDAHKIMIFVLISIAWLTIVAIILNACRSAARGDEILARGPASAAPHRTGAGIDIRPLRDRPGLSATQHLQRVHAGAFGSRGERVRGGSCVTGL
jgi:hypothetical protein